MPTPIEELRRVRLNKLTQLRNKGINPYPAKAKFRLLEIRKAKNDFKKHFLSKKPLAVAGRIISKREHGGLSFAHVRDGLESIQLLFTKDRLGDKSFSTFLELVDVGDFIAASGKAFYTKKGEATLELNDWQMLSKAVLPLPDKWHGLQDIEERFRKRYLDILMNPGAAERFILRSRAVEALRSLLAEEGYLEVETPILQPIYGGALAEPFRTHHRMLDLEMYLRIAPELYLKRLLAAGFSKIYEIGRNFRNEGLDATHNPEFTTVELYEAFRDASYLRTFIWTIIKKLVKAVSGKNSVKFGEHLINLPVKAPTIAFWKVLERHALLPGAENFKQAELVLRAKRLGINADPQEPKEKIADEIFKKVCRPKMINPTYVVDYPIAISPLAKTAEGRKDIVDRFQLIIGGIELINGFSELNDPLEQKKRFEAQEVLRSGEFKEAHPMDDDFIEMMEYGMPPAAGLAVSIDRLTMLLTDTHNIKEVVLFPTMKPK